MAITILENQLLASQLDHYRAKLLPYAYNILGDVLAAEDVVQDVLNRYFLNTQEHVKHQDNYLIRSVVNGAINQKNLLRNQKEEYLGEWLPTPVFSEEGIYSGMDSSKKINYALMVLLEALNPRERAVFILKETFDFSHAEIADLLEMSVDNSRQLLKRSKEKLELNTLPSVSVSDARYIALKKLTDAILEADIEKITHLLSEDVQCISDGGNKVNAARKVLTGQLRVRKLLQAIYGKYLLEGSTLAYTSVNNSPAIVYRKGSLLYRCIVFEMEEDVVQKVFIIVNPDKLKALKK